MTIIDAARMLGLSPKTLRQQIKNRKLRAHKMGRLWFVKALEVERYAADHRRKQPDE